MEASNTNKKNVPSQQKRSLIVPDRYAIVAAFIEYLEDIQETLKEPTKYTEGWHGWSEPKHENVPVIEHVYDQGKYQGVYRCDRTKFGQAIQLLPALIQDVLKEKSISIAKLGRQSMADNERAEKIETIFTALSYQFGFANIASVYTPSLFDNLDPLTEQECTIIGEQAVNEMMNRRRKGYDDLEKLWGETKRKQEDRLKDEYYAFWARCGPAGRKPGGQRPNENIYQQKLNEIRSGKNPFVNAIFRYNIIRSGTGLYNIPSYNAYESCTTFTYGDWEEIRKHAKAIIAQEMPRFSLFTTALQETIRFCDALTRQPGWKQPQINDLAELIRFLNIYLGQPVEAKEETDTIYSSFIESELIDGYWPDYTPTVEPIIPSTTPTILGYEAVDSTKTDRQVTVDDIARRSGCYIVGVAGTGKSSELEAMIWQDIAKGYPVVVFDPHGQLLDNIIARMPEQFIQKTYLLDLADPEYMFGLNIFACEDIDDEQERAKTFGSVKVAFSKLFPEADKKLFGTTLRHVAYSMIEHPEMTLQDIPRFIQDEAYREEKIKDLRHGQTKRYWQQTFSKKAPSKQQTETDPFLNRVDELLSSNTIRRVLCQPQTTIDFRRVIENRQIVLIRLPVEDEYAEAAGIIGTILLSKIAAATFSFSDIAREKDRPGYSFYVDEFQNFESVDMARLYTQARKYGARLCLAHQTRKGQLTLEEVEAATISASTKLFFRTIADDSRDLARSISDLQLKTRPDHIPHEVLKLLPYHENPQVKAFSNLIVVPLQRWQGKEENLVEQAGLFYWSQNKEKNTFSWARRQFKEGLHEIEVFLRDAMVHQQVDLYKLEYLMNIFAVRLGYANYYLHTFLEVPRTKKTWVRVDDEQIHYHSVAPTEAETAKEKAVYDEFRAMLTVVANFLIADPVGDKRETTQNERADFLSNLPKRTAVVKIESTTVVMQTRDLDELAKAVSESERDTRKTQIIQRTHAKYCKTNEEIDELAYEENEASEDIQNNTLRSNPTLATLAQIRHDIEKFIKALYAKYPPTDAKSGRPGLRAMVQSLRKQSILDSSLTITLQEIIEIANHVIHGETVKPEQATHAIDLSSDAIAALNRILQPNEATSTWPRIEPLE